MTVSSNLRKSLKIIPGNKEVTLVTGVNLYIDIHTYTLGLIVKLIEDNEDIGGSNRYPAKIRSALFRTHRDGN